MSVLLAVYIMLNICRWRYIIGVIIDGLVYFVDVITGESHS